MTRNRIATPRLSMRGAAALAVLLSSLLGCGDGANRGSGESTAGAVGEAGESRLRVQRFWVEYRAANAARLAGRFDEAEQRYRAALALDSRHEDALYYLGNVLLERGEDEAAAESWRALLEVNPASARAHLQLGNVALCRTGSEQHDLESAARSFRAAHALNREETGSQLRLAQVSLLQGLEDSAVVYLDAVLGSHTTSPEALYLRAWIDWKSGRRDRAIRRYREGIASAGEAPPVPVAGEGDTRRGSAPIGLSEAGCPALDGIVPRFPLPESELEAAFQVTGRTLATRR